MGKDQVQFDGGFILLARNIHESPVMEMPPHFREIWHYLLRKAQYKEARVGARILKRGQCLVRSEDVRNDLSWMQGFKRMRYTDSQYKNALSAFVKQGMIVREKTARGTLVTIINYDFYQNPMNYRHDGMPFVFREKNDEKLENALGNSGEQGQDKAKQGNKEKPPSAAEKTSSKRKTAKNRDIPREYLDLSADYLRKHMEIYPNLTKRVEDSKVKSGAAALEKLVRIDGFSLELIRQVVFWAVRDEFWGANLQSLGSLRDASKKNGEIKFKNIMAGWERYKRQSSSRKPAQYRQDKDYGLSDAGFLGV